MSSNKKRCRKGLRPPTAAMPRQVPWYNWGEWISVKRGIECALYGNTDGEFREASVEAALHKLQGWRCRMGGRLALALEATVGLVELDRIRDFHESSELERLALSMAIVRLVNGIADSKQTGRFAASLSVLAGAAGVHRWLIDIRHSAAHSSLPSLEQLRAAASVAKCWLWEHYWVPQEAALHEAAQAASCAKNVSVVDKSDVESIRVSVCSIASLPSVTANILASLPKDANIGHVYRVIRCLFSALRRCDTKSAEYGCIADLIRDVGGKLGATHFDLCGAAIGIASLLIETEAAVPRIKVNEDEKYVVIGTGNSASDCVGGVALVAVESAIEDQSAPDCYRGWHCVDSWDGIPTPIGIIRGGYCASTALNIRAVELPAFKEDLMPDWTCVWNCEE